MRIQVQANPDTLNPHETPLPSDTPNRPLQDRHIVIIGAGMVGVCVALELQRRGARVTLIDRSDPGQETSYGNAGVLARSSLVPLNNPALLRDLFPLATNRKPALRYDPAFVLRNLGWVLRFLAAARPAAFRETVTALDGLIRLSIDRHLGWLEEAGLSGHLCDRGWLFLYRQEAAWQRGAAARDIMDAHGIDTLPLSGAALRDIEPGLNPIFPRALWIRDSYSVDDPGAVVAGYANAFAQRGGTIRRAELRAVDEGENGATLHFDDGETLQADNAVLCLGPWGRTFLEASGYRVILAWERGYHRHFQGPPGENAPLARPIFDTGGGYVLSPMRQGLRMTTGVELTRRDAPPNHRQLDMAEVAARQAVALGEYTSDAPWLGSRPTFPDSRPAIGPLPGTRQTMLAFGHQHIGFMTGPGTACLLADLLEGDTPCIDPEPFAPSRFIRRR